MAATKTIRGVGRPAGRVIRNRVVFHLTDADMARLTDRGAQERAVGYSRPPNANEMARRYVLEALAGEVRLSAEARADVEGLRLLEESFADAAERLLRVGIGRQRALEKQRGEKA